MIPDTNSTADSLRTVAFAAYRRVYKSDPSPNPSLGEGLKSAWGGNRNPDSPYRLQLPLA